MSYHGRDWHGRQHSRSSQLRHLMAWICTFWYAIFILPKSSLTRCHLLASSHFACGLIARDALSRLEKRAYEPTGYNILFQPHLVDQTPGPRVNPPTASADSSLQLSVIGEFVRTRLSLQFMCGRPPVCICLGPRPHAATSQSLISLSRSDPLMVCCVPLWLFRSTTSR